MAEHTFDRQKWASLTIFEQMGNIGSEVGRALRAKQNGDSASQQAAFHRGLDLLDATADTWLAKNPARLNEILRARESFATSMFSDQPDPKLESYFMHFAMAARLQR